MAFFVAETTRPTLCFTIYPKTHRSFFVLRNPRCLCNQSLHCIIVIIAMHRSHTTHSRNERIVPIKTIVEWVGKGRKVIGDRTWQERNVVALARVLANGGGLIPWSAQK